MGLVSVCAPYGAEYAERAALLHLALLDYQNDQNDLLSIIFASGVSLSPTDQLKLCVFVAAERLDVDGGEYNITQIPEVSDLIRSAVGLNVDWLNEIQVLVAESPEEESRIGASIYASRQRGTAGPKVSWNGGDGFLTAGHVAPLGSNIYSSLLNRTTSSKLGTVVYDGYKRGTAPMPMADVAVVELSSNQSYLSAISSSSHAMAGQTVTIHNGRSGTSARVMGYCTFVNWPKTNALYGNCYFTTRHVTRGGNSGSAVSNSNSEVVGMVVGGSSRFTTFFQDIHYLISSISKAAPSLAGLNV